MTQEEQKFIAAVQSGDQEVVQVMLAYDPALLEVPTEIGVSVILLSAYYGYPELAAYLAGQKPKLSIFEAAATGRQSDVEKRLQENPEAINSFASDGFTPLGLATFFGHLELVKYLLEKSADVNLAARNSMKTTPLHSAAARRRTAIARILLEGGAEVNARQTSGVTALHSAAHNGNLELLKILLENGADKTLRTEEGKTALDFAAEKDFTEIEAFLEK